MTLHNRCTHSADSQDIQKKIIYQRVAYCGDSSDVGRHRLLDHAANPIDNLEYPENGVFCLTPMLLALHLPCIWIPS